MKQSSILLFLLLYFTSFSAGQVLNSKPEGQQPSTPKVICLEDEENLICIPRKGIKDKKTKSRTKRLYINNQPYTLVDNGGTVVLLNAHRKSLLTSELAEGTMQTFTGHTYWIEYLSKKELVITDGEGIAVIGGKFKNQTYTLEFLFPMDEETKALAVLGLEELIQYRRERRSNTYATVMEGVIEILGAVISN